MAEYILNGSNLTISAYGKSISVDVPRILASNSDAVIDTLVFEEGIENIVGIGIDFFTSGENLRGIETVVLPESIVSLGSRVFKECSSLKKVVFPKSLVEIGNECFSGCVALEKIELPDSVASIGKYAFSHCSSLESMRLPQSLTVIEDGVFNECTSLRQIVIPEGITTIGDFAFSGTGIQKLVLPSSVQTLAEAAFGVLDPEMEVFIPNDAPAYTSKAYLEMLGMPAFRVFNPKQQNSAVNYASITCPRCSSNNVSQRKIHKVFSFIKALLFYFVYPLAFLLGFIGKNRTECSCNDCGQTWYIKPGKLSLETLGEWFMYL